MKLLAIDSGNSRIKWGFNENGQWLERGNIPTAEAYRFGDVVAHLPEPQRIVAANVAGAAVEKRISDSIAAARGEPLWIVSRAEQCGVRSSYADPAQLGPDRWAALIAARHLQPGACVVVNAGTTMTVDVLTADSIFVGGIIVAGYAVMREALSKSTARLGLRDGRFGFFPDNTGDAICSGALNALAGAVDRIQRYLDDSQADSSHILLSGGDAARLKPLLTDAQVVDNLVLEGLLRIGASDV